jgi:hypothetical protein
MVDLRKKIIDKLEDKDKLIASLKDQISWYELNMTGLRKINGGDVLVKNLKIDEKFKVVKADINLIHLDMGDGEHSEEKIKDCAYPFRMFKEFK